MESDEPDDYIAVIKSLLGIDATNGTLSNVGGTDPSNADAGTLSNKNINVPEVESQGMGALSTVNVGTLSNLNTNLIILEG